MRKKWIYIAAAIVVVALAVFGTIYYYNSNNYVAKVGNEKITVTEYKFFLGLVKYQFGEELNITDWKSKVGNQTAEEMAKEAALERAREFKIELIKAKKNNIKLVKADEDALKKNFDSIITQSGSRVEAENRIKEQLGISWDQYKSIVRNIELTKKLRTAEMDKVKPSDDEAKKYYEDNKKSFDKATVKHILISTRDESGNPLPEDKQKEAEKKANDILARVNAGEDFAALAKQYSEDPGSKDKGGEYTIVRGQMVKEFEEWTFDTKHNIGDTGVVKTDFGFHVMKLESRGVFPFDEVKDNIKNVLKEEAYSKQMEGWKKEPEFNITKNQGEYNSIKIV